MSKDRDIGKNKKSNKPKLTLKEKKDKAKEKKDKKLA